MANGSYKGHMSSEKNRKVRESFLFLDQTKENKLCGGEKKKKKRIERKTKEKRKKNQFVGKEGKREKKGKERREK